jgi:hypothetical protein
MRLQRSIRDGANSARFAGRIGWRRLRRGRRARIRIVRRSGIRRWLRVRLRARPTRGTRHGRRRRRTARRIGRRLRHNELRLRWLSWPTGDLRRCHHLQRQKNIHQADRHRFLIYGLVILLRIEDADNPRPRSRDSIPCDLAGKEGVWLAPAKLIVHNHGGLNNHRNSRVVSVSEPSRIHRRRYDQPHHASHRRSAHRLTDLEHPSHRPDPTEPCEPNRKQIVARALRLNSGKTDSIPERIA